MNIKIKRLHELAKLPEYAHGSDQDAGMDLYAVQDAVLHPGVPVAVPTGLSIELPRGYEAQIRPRSGMALKHAVTVANAPGTIDPSYRGEVMAILINLGRSEYRVHAGDKICQMVIAKYEAIRWEECVELAESTRGANGFGSSGF